MGALRRLGRVPVPLVAAVLPAVLPALLLAPTPAVSALSAVSATPGCGTGGLLLRTPVSSARPASGVAVRAWNGTDDRGHPVRLTVAEADLRRVRLAAATTRRYGDVRSTTALTGAVPTAAAGVNGDYFGYDWSGDAVPAGPLVVGGRILRLPAGAHPVVGADTAGRPVAAAVHATGSVRSARGTLPVGSVNDDADPDRPDPVRAGRAVAVVTPWLGAARPARQRELVVRRGVVVAAGRRLSFGAGHAFGSGRAGRADLLLAADGAAGRRLALLRRGARVRVGYDARTARGVHVVQAVGSGAVMLRAGRAVVGCSGAAARSRPRTLVAWNASRSRLWLITVNGRGGEGPLSRFGATYRQVADVARSFGAAEAVMVDGGGSTTMALRGRDGRVRRVDAPDGTPQRPVPDGLVLIPR